MESTVVNARVPVAKRDAAKSLLESMGKTTSDLINSAFDFLLVEGTLPIASGASANPARDMADFRNFAACSTLAVDWGEDASADYKELLAQALERDYERLS